MADKVEAGGIQKIAHLGTLLLELLHIILAEIAQAELVGFANRVGWKFLGDRDQLNVGWVATGASRRASDPSFDLG
jgi:hypothetical protein